MQRSCEFMTVSILRGPRARSLSIWCPRMDEKDFFPLFLLFLMDSFFKPEIDRGKDPRCAMCFPAINQLTTGVISFGLTKLIEISSMQCGFISVDPGIYGAPRQPLMPKSLGGLYLRLIARSPKFLYESGTYTTLPGVVSRCWKLGRIRLRDEQINSVWARKTSPKWSPSRRLSGSGPCFN